MKARAHHWLALAFGVLCTTAACRKDDPLEHLQRGTNYLQAGQHPDAVVELRRAIQLNPSLGEARLKLGDSYSQTNQPGNAVREYVRAADLLPERADAQLKAGNFLLIAGRFEDAKARADGVLARDPNNIEAQILRGNALAGVKDFDAAIADYETVIAADPTQHQVFVNLGTIQLAQGKRDEAEAAFKRAVEVAPKSLAARLALANFYWASKRTAESETALKAAHELDPSDMSINRALGVFYMATGRAPEAEPFFKALAAGADTGTGLATLANYYVIVNRPDEARRVLTNLATRPDSFAVATVRLAALDASEGRRADAERRLRELLEKKPDDAAANLLNADLLLRDRKRDEALIFANAAIASNPSSAQAHYIAGSVYAQGDRIEQAIGEYEQALRLNPRSAAAAIQLARLHLGQGNVDKSLTYARQATGIDPTNADAQAFLVRGLVRRGETGKAKEAVAALQKAAPTASAAFDLLALVQLAEKQPEAARKSYLRALELAPTDLEALGGITRLDLTTKRAGDATARLDALLARAKPSVDLLLLAAQGYAAAGDSSKSETILKQAIELDPGRLQGYGMLGQLYARQHRVDEAIKQFDVLRQREPKSVTANTMVGMLFEQMGQTAKAEEAYERVLAIDSRSAVAANNLAWLYAASNRKLDEALQLARTAQQQLPDEANINDTLGWIYVRKNLASLALTPLQSSVNKVPDNPVFHYHLGIAYKQSGDFEKAKRALTKALSLKTDFDGAADARKALSDIG